MPSTPSGLPYPAATDPVKDGAAAIQALAVALEPIAHVPITANFVVTATTEPTAQTLVTAPAVTLDGATAIMVEYACPRIDFAIHSLVLLLFDGAVAVGRCDFGNNSVVGFSMALNYRAKLLPAAGAHTYSWRAYLGAGTTGITLRCGAPFFNGHMRIERA